MSPEQDTNKPTLLPVPSAVNSFPLLFPPPRPGEGTPVAAPGFPHLQECGGARRYLGRGGGRLARGREFHLHLGNLLPLPPPPPAQGARPWLRPDGPRPGEPGRGCGRRWGSSQGQVPQGHTRPGGCKPQAKVESAWSFSSNPFYTVKTAKLSPRRPLFNWEANRRKIKTNAQADSFPLFSPQQKARCLAKRETHDQRKRLLASGPGVGRAGGGLHGAALCTLSPQHLPECISDRVPVLHGSRRSNTLHASRIVRFLVGAEGQMWALGCWRLRARKIGPRSRFFRSPG